MPEERYMCLESSCGHTFWARRPISGREYVRCSSCRSYLVIPESEYLKCKAGALELIRTTPLGELPIWDVVQAVFAERGVSLTPRLTWRLCTRLWSDVLQETRKQGMEK